MSLSICYIIGILIDHILNIVSGEHKRAHTHTHTHTHTLTHTCTYFAHAKYRFPDQLCTYPLYICIYTYKAKTLNGISRLFLALIHHNIIISCLSFVYFDTAQGPLEWCRGVEQPLSDNKTHDTWHAPEAERVFYITLNILEIIAANCASTKHIIDILSLFMLMFGTYLIPIHSMVWFPV